MRSAFEGYSPWWGITARFAVISTITWILTIIFIRVPIAELTNTRLWGQWWAIFLHFATGFIAGTFTARWIIGNAFRNEDGRWRRNY